MTLSDPGCRDEIFSGLERGGLGVHEVVLTASPAVLEARIVADVLVPDDPERDDAARQWRWQRRHQARQLQEVASRAHHVDTTARGRWTSPRWLPVHSSRTTPHLDLG